MTIETSKVDFNFNTETETNTNTLSLLTIGSNAFTVQVFNYTINDVSFGINIRLEEELPYEANSYDYTGFSYLDFSCSYVIGNFNIGVSVENLLNLNSQAFSIDPNLETANGITSAFYLSHESDALVALAVTYNF